MRRTAHSRLKRLSILLVVLLGLAASAPPLSAAVGPSDERVLLGNGRSNGLHWRVELHREASALACLDLGIEKGSGRGRPPYFESCSSASVSRLVTYTDGSNGKRLTLMAGIFSPRLVRLELEGKNGRIMFPTIRRISPAASRRVGLPRVRYMRRVFPGSFCYSRAVGFNAQKEVIYRSQSIC